MYVADTAYLHEDVVSETPCTRLPEDAKQTLIAASQL